MQWDRVISKVHQCTSLLWWIRSCISFNLARDLYNSLIDPIFIYCSHIYDACSLNACRQLKTCQNIVIRPILRVGNRYWSESLHVESGIPWRGVQRAKTTCVEIYKIVDQMGPPSLCKNISIKENTRALHSSASVQLNGPLAKHKFAKSDFLVRGCKYWAMLPHALQNAQSLYSFKKGIKANHSFENNTFTNYKNVFYLT